MFMKRCIWVKHTLVLPLGTTDTSLVPSSLSPPLRGLWTPAGAQEPPQAGQSQLPQPFPRAELLQPLDCPCGSAASPEEAALPQFLPLAALAHPFPLM